MRWYLRAVALILFSTAFLKVYLLTFGHTPLPAHDGLTGLPNLVLLWLAVVVELAAVGILLLSRRPLQQLTTAAALGFLFLCYHAGMVIVANGSSCSCFGVLSSWIPVVARWQRSYAVMISLFMVAGGVWFMLRLPLNGQLLIPSGSTHHA